MPEVWVSRWRMRISPCGLRGNHGAKRWIGSSSETRPRSTSCRTAVAAIGLEIEAIRNTDAGDAGTLTSRSAQPKPCAQTTDSPTTMAADSPGVPKATRASSDRRASTAGSRSPRTRAGCWADTAADSSSTGASAETERRCSRRRICWVGRAVRASRTVTASYAPGDIGLSRPKSGVAARWRGEARGRFRCEERAFHPDPSPVAPGFRMIATPRSLRVGASPSKPLDRRNRARSRAPHAEPLDNPVAGHPALILRSPDFHSITEAVAGQSRGSTAKRWVSGNGLRTCMSSSMRCRSEATDGSSRRATAAKRLGPMGLMLPSAHR